MKNLHVSGEALIIDAIVGINEAKQWLNRRTGFFTIPMSLFDCINISSILSICLLSGVFSLKWSPAQSLLSWKNNFGVVLWCISQGQKFCYRTFRLKQKTDWNHLRRFAVLAESSLRCISIREAVANCHPDVTRIFFISQDLLLYPAIFISPLTFLEVSVSLPSHWVIGFPCLFASIVPGFH